MKLTPIETKVLAFIRTYQTEHGFGPSYSEIMAEFIWASTRTANVYVKKLEDKGALTRYRQPGMQRYSYRFPHVENPAG